MPAEQGARQLKLGQLPEVIGFGITAKSARDSCSMCIITTSFHAPRATATHTHSRLPASLHKTHAVIRTPQPLEMCGIRQTQLQVSDLSLPFFPGVATTSQQVDKDK